MKHLLPRMAAARVRYIQVARRGPSEADGIDILSDTRTPDRLHLVGAWTLANEMFDGGTLPQTTGDRLCSQHFKAWPLDTVIAELTQGQPYRHIMGYELNEPKRAQRDATYNTALRTGEYPLRTWKWDRARALAFLKKIFGVDWIKSACTYCLLSALMSCLDRTPYRQRPVATVLHPCLSRMYVRDMELIFFSSGGWESWDIQRRPIIPDGMPVLVDDDLVFEDASGLRPVTFVNRWLRELPSSGCPAPSSWESYARVLRSWMEFIVGFGVNLFDERRPLKNALSAYAVHRACGPIEARFEVTTWDRHVSVLSSFYRWAVVQGHAQAEPFTYAQARTLYGDQVRDRQVNLAVRRRPKAHVTIKYLERDFEALFLKALAGLMPDGAEDTGYRGRELARNAAIGRLGLATGLRRQEFT